MLHRLAALSLLALTFACGGPAPDPRLAPLANATLEAGHGLGDLVLGETTLREVLARFGSGRVSLLAGDEAAFELSYVGGQLDLLFGVPLDWYQNGAPLRDATRDIETFAAAHPEYGDLPLTSLAVGLSRSGRDTFFTGSLSRGGRLAGPIDEVLAGYGPARDGPGLFVAGMSPSNPDSRAMYRDLGMIVYYRDENAEKRRPGDGPPEEPAEDREEREPPKIELITIFLPGAS